MPAAKSVAPEGRSTAALVLVALAVTAAHTLVNLVTPYGFQRDEFLYLAMGEHLRWWRMDFPPFIALVARSSRALFGDALWAIRLLPGVAGGLLAAVTLHMVRQFVPAPHQWRASLAALAALVTAPVFLRSANMLQPVVFDQLWWTLALWGLLERERRDDLRWWCLVGAALGVGLLTKFSIAFIGVGIVAGVLGTPLRRDLRTRWPWLALLLALSIGAPSLTGQWLLDWPIVWQMRDLRAGQLDARNPFAFFTEQPLLVGPPAFVLAMTGLWWLFARGRARATAAAVVVCWLWLGWQQGKAYYGAPVYPLLFAAGGAALAQLSARWSGRLTAGFVGSAVLLGLVALPLAVPILSPARTAAYATALGVAEATATNYGTQLALPQDFADMLGWPEQARAVATEWDALTPSERESAVLAASNYGRAGALDFYGRQYGLPPVVSAAGSYWFFGPGKKPGAVVIALTDRADDLAPLFERCRTLRLVGTPWGVEEERRVAVVRCDGPKVPLQQIWPSLHPARQ